MLPKTRNLSKSIEKISPQQAWVIWEVVRDGPMFSLVGDTKLFSSDRIARGFGGQRWIKKAWSAKGLFLGFSVKFSDMAVSQACCSIPPVVSDYQPTGSYGQIDDLPYYLVGPKVKR